MLVYICILFVVGTSCLLFLPGLLLKAAVGF